jgi:beta-N-acetylhexosaminidase
VIDFGPSYNTSTGSSLDIHCFDMADQNEPEIKYDIRSLTQSDQDFEEIWQMWQTIFPDWPIERQRMKGLFRIRSEHHYIHDKGFCLSFLTDGPHGKIAAIGVLPEHRGKGLGTALLEKAKAGLSNAAHANGEGELKSLAIGSSIPTFWPQLPKDLPQEVKDFFLHRGK